METTIGKPETQAALLRNEAGKWTRHEYDHSEVDDWKNAGWLVIGKALYHVFRCAETGALRRWGCEPVYGSYEVN